MYVILKMKQKIKIWIRDYDCDSLGRLLNSQPHKWQC